ncbi:hypothetical protein BaRGS_00024267, partial [Batillaria attramentaria]
CPDGWQAFQSSCYGFGDEPATWYAAQEACSLFGAKLAEVRSEAEDDFLRGVARSQDYWGLWLGGTDMFSEGRFVWTSNQKLISNQSGYTNWGHGQPNDSGQSEDCAHLWRDIEYLWNDAPCTTLLNFACEIRLDVTFRFARVIIPRLQILHGLRQVPSFAFREQQQKQHCQQTAEAKYDASDPDSVVCLISVDQ